MLRIEEICTNVDDDFRDHLLELDDDKLRALLADSTALRHLLPMGVSYKEAVTAITAIMAFRAQPPEDIPPPPAITEPEKKKRAPRKKKPVPQAPSPTLPRQAEGGGSVESQRLLTAEGGGSAECQRLLTAEDAPKLEQPEPKPVIASLPPAPRPLPPPHDHLALPPLKQRWRDHAILVIPMVLALAVLVILLIKR